MVKVFFADAGSLDQLHGTLESVAREARSQRLDLMAMIEATDAASAEFARRLHINALALRFHLDYQDLLAELGRVGAVGVGLVVVDRRPRRMALARRRFSGLT